MNAFMQPRFFTQRGVSALALLAMTSGIFASFFIPNTALAQATRDPLKQPFASNSIWNMPIGSGAQYVAINLPSTATDFSYEANSVWTPMPQIDDDIIVLKPTAPMTTINYSNVGWNGGDRCPSTASSGQGLPVSVPIPSNYYLPSDNANDSAAFLLADGRTIVQTQPFTRCSGYSYATSLVKFPNTDLYGDGRIGSHGGSELSALGGTIRLGELRPGQQGPKHALKFIVDSRVVLYNCSTTAECFRWPAFVADSGATSAYGSIRSGYVGMKMGALLAIPASTNIANLGLETEPAKQLAWTMQNYGGYIDDSTGGPSFGFGAEKGPDGDKRTEFQADWGTPLEQRINSNTPWSRDMARLVRALYLVNNNSPTSIGGGGTPRQPLAPAI